MYTLNLIDRDISKDIDWWKSQFGEFVPPYIWNAVSVKK
jgi:hypothetical protein